MTTPAPADLTQAPPIDSEAQRRVALAVSGLFHPAALPTWAFAAILFGRLLPTGVSGEGRLWLLGVLAFITLGLPAGLIFVARYLGVVDDWQLRPKADRLFSLWLTAALYIGATWGLYAALPTLIFRLMAGLAGLALLKAVINLFYRLSGHAMAIAAFTAYWATWASLSGNRAFLMPLVACVLATGLVVWARLTLGAHTVGQSLWGLALGLAAGIGVGVWSAQ